MKYLTYNYWIKRLEQLQFKKREREGLKKTSKFKSMVLKDAQDKHIRCIKALIISQFKEEVRKSLVYGYIDYLDLITKGNLKEERIFRIDGNHKKYKLKLKIEVIK